MADMPIYVKIEEYRDVLDVLNMIKHKLSEAKETLAKINDLKNQEDLEIERWMAGLESVSRKVEAADKLLFEPEAV
ncbi:hypothetical protein KY311_02105 [Candidatus Woesearchaeota archaeon]|nr:hypothetical protein [Candidatus Woesearchaeota archaeon]MBW3017514.1 hypothetical protein [Candidatus Woesearchaeota archaeon]